MMILVWTLTIRRRSRIW